MPRAGSRGKNTLFKDVSPVVGWSQAWPAHTGEALNTLPPQSARRRHQWVSFRNPVLVAFAIRRDFQKHYLGQIIPDIGVLRNPSEFCPLGWWQNWDLPWPWRQWGSRGESIQGNGHSGGFGPLRQRRPEAKGSGKGSGCPTEHFSLLKPMEHRVH